MDVLKLVRALSAGAALSVMFAGAASAGPGCLSEKGCIRDAEIESILREYSNPLFVAAGLNPDDISLYLVNDPTLNAFVAAGQNLSINTGTIILADTPEQLKGVIAHETGHIAGGHNVTFASTARAANGTSLISMGLGVIAIAAGAPDAGMALLGSAQEFGALTAFKFMRQDEMAADQYGLQFMDKTHQSGMGLVTFMERFRSEELMSESRRQPYFVTHPLSSDRIALLRKRAEENEKDALPQPQKAIDQLAIMKAKLIGFIGPPSKVAIKYPASDTSIPARYARAIAAFKASDIKKGLELTQGLIDSQPDNPYFQELYGQILFESGKVEESIPYHRRSVELAPDQPLLKVNLAQSLVETKKPENWKEAEDNLVVAISREKDNPYAWEQLAAAYSKEGKEGDAALATAEEAYIVGAMPRAMQFARRASQKLSPDTPNGRRALDILAMADPRALQAERR